MPPRWKRHALTLATLVLAGCASSTSAPAGSPKPTPSPSVKDATADDVLQRTWAGYKAEFIEADGRVVDPDRDRATTSEGQSYAMLRAAWMNDRATFAATWKWTQANLQVRGDKLFGWLWSPKGGLQDRHSATDGDQDIALALLLGAARFQEAAYRDDAVTLLADLWAKDLADVAGLRIPVAGDWAPAVRDPGAPVNPSYFSPYAYRVFARADPRHDWNRVVDDSYTALAKCTVQGLPSNWCAIDGGGAVHSYMTGSGGDNYGYDAFRAFWRLALDAAWNREARARDYLRKGQKVIGPAVGPLDRGGKPAGGADPTFLAGVIPVAMNVDPDGAKKTLDEVLLPLVHDDAGIAYFDRRANYYEQNWLWFTVALARGELPNLAG